MKTTKALGIVTVAGLMTAFAVVGDAQGAVIDMPASKIATVLGSTHDQCSGVLKVIDGNNNVQTIPRGVLTEVWVRVPRFGWYCGNTLEHSTCPAGTKRVHALHHTDSRQIDWTCLAP